MDNLLNNNTKAGAMDSNEQTSGIQRMEMLDNQATHIDLETLEKNKSGLESESSSRSSKEMFTVKFSELSEEDKKIRLKYLWQKAISRARGGAILVRKYLASQNRLFNIGHKNKYTLDYLLVRNAASMYNDQELEDDEYEYAINNASFIIFPQNRKK